jgi:hypothetical protein
VAKTAPQGATRTLEFTARAQPVEVCRFASSNDATSYAGLAVLALSESPKAIDAELLIALGTHLMQMGDARGLRV